MGRLPRPSGCRLPQPVGYRFASDHSARQPKMQVIPGCVIDLGLAVRVAGANLELGREDPVPFKYFRDLVVGQIDGTRLFGTARAEAGDAAPVDPSGCMVQPETGLSQPYLPGTDTRLRKRRHRFGPFRGFSCGDSPEFRPTNQCSWVGFGVLCTGRMSPARVVNTSALNSEPRTRFGDEKFAIFMPAAIALRWSSFSTPPTKLPTGLATLDVARQ